MIKSLVYCSIKYQKIKIYITSPLITADRSNEAKIMPEGLEDYVVPPLYFSNELEVKDEETIQRIDMEIR